MGNDTTRQGVLFKEMASRPVVVRFDQEHSSSDGGSLLLKALDERLGLSAGLAGCLRDSRQAGKVQHELQELLRQRLFGIASGHADGNDAARSDPQAAHRSRSGIGSVRWPPSRRYRGSRMRWEVGTWCGWPRRWRRW